MSHSALAAITEAPPTLTTPLALPARGIALARLDRQPAGTGAAAPPLPVPMAGDVTTLTSSYIQTLAELRRTQVRSTPRAYNSNLGRRQRYLMAKFQPSLLRAQSSFCNKPTTRRHSSLLLRDRFVTSRSESLVPVQRLVCPQVSLGSECLPALFRSVQVQGVLQEELEAVRTAAAQREEAAAAELARIRDELVDMQRQMHTFSIPST